MVLGGSSGFCSAGPGIHAGCACSCCSVRCCWLPDALPGVGGVLVGWAGCAAPDADACPGVGGMLVGNAGAGCCDDGVEDEIAFLKSNLSSRLRRLEYPPSPLVGGGPSSSLIACGRSNLSLLWRHWC